VVYAWGDGSYGQTGNRIASAAFNPRVALVVNSGGTRISNIRQVGCTLNTSFAVSSAATVLAWGGSENGELGNGTTVKSRAFSANVRRSSARPGANLNTALRIACGDRHILVLTTSNTVVGWGQNTSQQINTAGGTLLYPATVSGLTSVEALSAGSKHSLALRNSSTDLYTWGTDAYGVLGNGLPLDDVTSPTTISYPAD
ncbi:MAG TPA: hypothetical protein PKO06_11015, partial [Candidatus Ozemobacteraceae bacterium]|nr:hypothetical protein [Candidatus Ozemobacteraceae bacterium]